MAYSTKNHRVERHAEAQDETTPFFLEGLAHTATMAYAYGSRSPGALRSKQIIGLKQAQHAQTHGLRIDVFFDATRLPRLTGCVPVVYLDQPFYAQMAQYWDTAYWLQSRLPGFSIATGSLRLWMRQLDHATHRPPFLEPPSCTTNEAYQP